MTRVVLLHGGRGGPWVWDDVRVNLTRLGVDCVAPELPMDDPRADLGAWAAAVAAVDAGPDAEHVIVAHSLAGLVLPLLPQLLSVRRLVYLAAAVGEPGQSYADYLQSPSGRGVLLLPSWHSDDPAAVMPWSIARAHLYQDCELRAARASWRRQRPIANTALRVAGPEHPSVPTTSVVLTDDRCISPQWSRARARMLGAELITRAGGHSPWLADPGGLAQLIYDLST